jgi:hypothetical protein
VPIASHSSGRRSLDCSPVEGNEAESICRDDAIRVAWPYQPETLVVKVGPSFVVGSGSAIRLDCNRTIGFKAQEIETLGTRTVIFDADIRDESGERWLFIDDNWFELKLIGTTNVDFPPQLRSLRAERGSNCFLSLRFKRPRVDEFLSIATPLFLGKLSSGDILRTIESVRALDSDGRVPLMTIEGRFRTERVALEISGDTMRFKCFIPGFESDFDWHAHIVDESRRMLLRQHGHEFFSLG